MRAFDSSSMQPVRDYSTAGMNHPTAITSYRDTLYVGDQDLKAVLSFSIRTAALIKFVVSDLPDDIEAMVLSTC